MGLLGWIKKDKENTEKKIENNTEKEPLNITLKEEDEVTIEKVDVVEEAKSYKSEPDRMKYIEDTCDMIVEAMRQIEETKVEYQAVTSYLTDIQIIDSIPMDERDSLNDAARKIITLTRDRTGYQNREKIRISEVMYKHMEQYEEEIPEEIDKMKENEEYLRTVKNDMRVLEGEKGSLQFKKEEIVKQQHFLKLVSILTGIVAGSLFVLFAIISSAYYKDMHVPYLLTIIMVMISIIYVFFEARKNIYDMKMTDKKQNRAVNLLNSVKIKYVNTTNLIEYSYHKYKVNSSNELKYLWEQYVKAKDVEKRYKSNTELLNYHNEILIEKLKKFHVGDPEIWIYQAIAIIDNKEMVEVRHRLNTRRRKLRERIDYNTKLKEGGMEKIEKLIEECPDWKDDVLQVLKKYNI